MKETDKKAKELSQLCNELMEFIKSVDYIGEIIIKATAKECKVKMKYPKPAEPVQPPIIVPVHPDEATHRR